MYDTNLMDFYQGSLYTPQGFKGFPSNATAAETAWICTQVTNPAQYSQCAVSNPGEPTTLPVVGASNWSYLIAFGVGLIVWKLEKGRHGKTS